MSEETLSLKLAQFAGLRDDGRHRDKMLALCRDLSMQSSDQVAAFLWLYDHDKERLHLDYHSPSETPLFGISLETPSASLDNITYVTAQIREQPEVKKWLVDQGFDQSIMTLFPVAKGLGYLNFFAPKAVEETALINGLCSAIAARISRHRDKRKLEIIAAIMKTEWGSNTTANDWLKDAAQITKNELKAKLVLVFRLNHEMELEVVASAPTVPVPLHLGAMQKSLVHKIYEKSKHNRILNHYDEKEREQEFGTIEYDKELVSSIELILGEKLRSWIGSAIRYGEDPMAILFVANKDEKEYIPAVFSRTDYELVESVCKLVSRAMPQIQTNAAIRKISKAIFESTTKEQSKEKNTKLESVIATIKDLIPGLVGAAIGLRNRAASPCIMRDSYIIADNIQETELLEARLKNPLAPHRKESFQIKTGYWIIERELTDIPNRVATLHLLVRRERLASYEQEILEFTCLDLGQYIRDRQSVKQHEQELIEFRHAIRASLQGLAHLDVACDFYEIMSKHGLSITALKASVLSKSLQLARLFATRSRHLVEETRYLLEEIESSQLKISSCNIAEIVRIAIRCLSPDATRRNIEILYNNQINENTTCVGDHFLIELTIFNLLDNAIKYSFRNKNISVRLFTRGGSWIFEVTDIGTYIYPEDYKTIFKTRVRRPTGHATRPGTGLGLAVVDQVINAHKGKCNVVSIPLDEEKPEEGATTTFTITVPLRIQ